MTFYGVSEFPETGAEEETGLPLPTTPTGLQAYPPLPPSPSPAPFSLAEPFGALEAPPPFSPRILEAMQLRVLPSILLGMVDAEAKAGTMEPACADALTAFLGGSQTVAGMKATLPAVQACADTSLSAQSVRDYLTWVLRFTAANQMELSGPEQIILQENLPEAEFQALVRFRGLLWNLRRATPVAAPPVRAGAGAGRGLGARPSVSVARTRAPSSGAVPPPSQPPTFPLGRGAPPGLGLGLGARLGFRPKT